MGRHGTIAGRKEKQDAKRSQIFTKYARAIAVAAKGGGDMEYNIALKNAVEKAKAINMPNDNINRAIKKGTGELGGESYESGAFEGYGPGGVAIIVETLTDNKNRTTSAVKHAFDKCGGNLGVPGCVGYMFNRKGFILIEKTDDISEDDLMEIGMDAGMEDMIVNDDSFEIYTDPSDFAAVADALRNAGYELLESDIDMIPSMTSNPAEGDIKNLKKLVAMLEDDDDVQKVYHNCEVDLED
ncbi:MAG: YebC/PmpR family DNA-binding transcriptional regulator [Firmicutes bacterium]|nr:YebC/PmpR family DNA-binding transcriptional regulator [Clostridiales bacterium]MBQ4340160.1 YebC/PmpR family DNA-binding transcriptional regulator [Bacillota bacterium]